MKLNNIGQALPPNILRRLAFKNVPAARLRNQLKETNAYFNEVRSKLKNQIRNAQIKQMQLRKTNKKNKATIKKLKKNIKAMRSYQVNGHNIMKPNINKTINAYLSSKLQEMHKNARRHAWSNYMAPNVNSTIPSRNVLRNLTPKQRHALIVGPKGRFIRLYSDITNSYLPLNNYKNYGVEPMNYVRRYS